MPPALENFTIMKVFLWRLYYAFIEGFISTMEALYAFISIMEGFYFILQTLKKSIAL